MNRGPGPTATRTHRRKEAAMFDYYHPVKLVFGAGTLAKLGAETRLWGDKALLVCSPFIVSCGLAGRAIELLASAGVAAAVFDRVTPNPTHELVDEGARLARRHNCKVIIGIGGGSSMDSAKAVAVAAGHDEPIWPYAIGDKQPTAATLPIVAVTTTAGTGSQCTPFAVISNTQTRQKPGFGGSALYPKTAIVDPEWMRSMPVGLTAVTGFDVFAHAAEAYTSQWASPFSELYACRAVELTAGHWPRALQDGQDMAARQGMALADTMAGIAIAQAGVSVAHVMAHVIGGHYPDIAHGDALYTVYKETLRFNAPGAPAKHRWLAAALVPGCDDIAAAFAAFFPAAYFANALRHKSPASAMLDTIARETFSYMALYAKLGPVAPTVADVRGILERSLS